jgi:Tfp pilus assembly protein PilE
MISIFESCIATRRGAAISTTMIALLFVVCISFSACQTYTTGLKQDVARANELAAMAGLHAIALAQQTYSVSNGGKYGTQQQLVEGGFLDPNVSNSEKKDYVFTMAVGPKAGSAGEEFYSCNADPKDKPGRHFYIDSTSRDVHVNQTQPATSTDPTNQP